MVSHSSRQELKAKSNKPISIRGDELKVTSLTRPGAKVGQSNKPISTRGDEVKVTSLFHLGVKVG
jgi:hypothetical protein